jgi:hypothetical protein
VPLNDEVDDIWHELILQTRFYAELCEALPGGQFIHHESLPLSGYITQHSGDSQVVREVMSWIPDYVQTFGPFAPDAVQYWTPCRFLTEKHGMNLDQINMMGAR